MLTGKKVRFEDLFPIIEETLGKGKNFSFCAFGNSMLPFIRNGKDTVTLGPINAPLAKNDVIFYRRKNGQFVLHRIVSARPDGSFYLCGDNQFRIEKGIEKHQVIARLIRLERDGKEISLNSLPARFWYFLLPFRRFWLHIKSSGPNRIKRIFKKHESLQP